RRRHTRFSRDWSSDVCSSDLPAAIGKAGNPPIHIAFGYNMLRCLHKPRPIGITNMARELITGHLSSFLKCESQGFKNGLRRRSLGEYFPDLLKDRTVFFFDVNLDGFS